MAPAPVAVLSLDEEAPMYAALEIERAVDHMDRAARAVEDTIAKLEEIIVDSERIDRIQSASRR
jgi:hypothetical protein